MKQKPRMRWFYKRIRLEHTGPLLSGCQAPQARGSRPSGCWLACGAVVSGVPGLFPEPSIRGSAAIRGAGPCRTWSHAPGRRAGTGCSVASALPVDRGQATLLQAGLTVLLRIRLLKGTADAQRGWAGPRAAGYGELARRATFWLAPTHLRGLSSGTFLLAPGLNTECSAGLEYEDSLVPPESFSLGSSIR